MAIYLEYSLNTSVYCSSGKYMQTKR